MNKHTRIWPGIAAALVVVAGVAVIWGVVVAWSGYLISFAWQGSERVYESMQVMADGTPVIQSSIMREPYDRTFRTLEGEPITPTREDWLTGAYFERPLAPPGLVEMPIGWRQRIAGLSSFERPPVGWYLVRDEEPLGRAYFVGYDEFSKLRIGYIGRNGFRRALPPKKEWFDLARHQLGWWGPLASTGNVQYGSRAYNYSLPAEEQRLPPWLAFLIDGERLLEVDLRARTVRTVYESPGLLAVAGVTEPPALPADAASPTTANRRESLVSRIAVRTSNRIVILDPPTGDKWEFVLPESLRSTPVYAYTIGSDQLLLQWGHGAYSWNPTELGWLEPDGTFARRETVTLAGHQPLPERQAAWIAAPIVPVPIGWLAGIGVGMPLQFLQTNVAATYSDGLFRIIRPTWPPLLAVLAIGFVLAWWTYWLQRRYRRPATGVWCAFVLLFGVPGFLAYWIEHRRPKMEACVECGQLVPRDREACAACESEFPAPPRVGTEIFA